MATVMSALVGNEKSAFPRCIINAYQELSSYRAAARLCGTSDRRVKRNLVRRETGQHGYRARPPVVFNTDVVKYLTAEKVRAIDAHIRAKRLLLFARAAGYTGSARNLRRAVAKVKAAWRRRRRLYRLWQPLSGEHLIIDWGDQAVLPEC